MLSALQKKRVRVGLGLILALFLAGGAYAYFTSSGNGTGGATVGTSSGLTITGTVTPATGGLVPGGTPAGVSFSVNNPGTAQEHVNQVSLTSVKAYTDSTMGTPVPGCDTSAFTMGTVTESATVGHGNTTLGTPGSLVFADNGTNQDACQGVYLALTFSSN